LALLFFQKNYTNIFIIGTQSPDAVNKLLRLSNSSHQVKARAPQRPNHSSTSSVLPSPSSSISTSSTTTGLSSLAESTHHRRHNHHVTKMRDTNKLTSESSSLNIKPTLYARFHTREFF
jgi:hypothetical protein